MFKVLSLHDKDEWSSFIKKLPFKQQDVYYFPEYYSLYENNLGGKAQCFVYSEEDKLVVYPYLLNSINKLGYQLEEQYFDIQGAYGYNGPISNSIEEKFLRNFSDTFCKYCDDSNIVGEFIRFNPVHQNHVFQNYIQPIKQLDNVLIDISLSEEDLWSKSFDRGVRKAINKGARQGLRSEVFKISDISQNQLDVFLAIYYSTLERQSANDFYYFNTDFFKDFTLKMKDKASLIFVYKDDQAISAELVTRWNEVSYGFLGGTLSDFYHLSPNSFLRFELIKYLKKLGVMYYSIGGGNSENDSVFKYKKSFSKNIQSDFYIGKKIHNQEIYKEVISQWESKYPESYQINKMKLLGYREI